MNRILYEPHECADGRITLSDHRAAHMIRVLKVQNGDEVRVGEVNGLKSTAEVLKTSDSSVVLEVKEGWIRERPVVDLVLALPRPKVLKRLLPQLSALGVDRLYLTNASKVERYYFDSKVLEQKTVRTLLIEGGMQSGETALPEVRIVRRLKPFIEDEADSLFGNCDRWILHPGVEQEWNAVQPCSSRCVLAIGPEGGWVPSELELFVNAGFQVAALGSRILRSDTASVLALGIATLRWSNVSS